MAGIQDTKELLIGLNEVAILLATRLKDGLDAEDFPAFYKALFEDAAFKTRIEAAYIGASNIPGELSDVQGAEAMELAMTQISYVPKLLAAFKRK